MRQTRDPRFDTVVVAGTNGVVVDAGGDRHTPPAFERFIHPLHGRINGAQAMMSSPSATWSTLRLDQTARLRTRWRVTNAVSLPRPVTR